ncbi:Mth938-like domain-containing protein [Dyella sp.]|uniref:Mth938-like domain-containing protein n=1 Tax=Dyella sp. TaxID=1869338 RepID=UPI003F7F3AE6
MDLSLDRPDAFLFVRRTAPGYVTVVDRNIEASFLLAPDRMIEQWPAVDAAAITPDLAAPFFDLQPELVLLGTGERQRFPPPEFLAAFLRRGVGIEVMDNAAAARTYDLLAGEGRRVVVGFILPGARAG